MSLVSYETGYLVAALEIKNGVASHVQAKQRGLYEGDQNSRIDWDAGYEACVCAYMLGHNIEGMIEQKVFEPSLCTTAHVVISILNDTWHNKTREDPRNEEEKKSQD